MIDPATNKAKSDATAIGYFEVYDNIPALRALKTGKFAPGELIKVALTMAWQHGCRTIFVEGIAYQSTLVYWLETISNQYNIQGMKFLEIHSHTSKYSRIISLFRSLERGEIIIHDNVRTQVFHEITNWNPIKLSTNIDDILDVMAYATVIPNKHTYDIWNTDIEDVASLSPTDPSEHMF